LVVPGPLQNVTTTNPIAGVHTRLTDEVEVWRIQRALQLVRQLGAPWIVEFFPWPYIEAEENEFNRGHSDTVPSCAENQGLTVIARLGWVPGWACPGGSDDTDGPEATLTNLDIEHYDDFPEYVADSVACYRPYVTHLIIWNEPTPSFE
jgi:hypothetical protein